MNENLDLLNVGAEDEHQQSNESLEQSPEQCDGSETDALAGPDSDYGKLEDHLFKAAYIRFLNNGVVLATRNDKDYQILSAQRYHVELHLSIMNCELIVDELRGVMFWQIKDVDIDAPVKLPSIVSTNTLKLFDSLILLVLRRIFQEREYAGEALIVTDAEEVGAALMPYVPLAKDEARDSKKINAALQRFKERRLLLSMRGSSSRYEISPIIRYVVDAETIKALSEQYAELAQSKTNHKSEDHL